MHDEFEGIVLFQRPYRENDGLVKIFTSNFGTRMFFIKGLNRPKHSLKTHTIPLTKHHYIGTVNEQGFSFLKEANSIHLFPHVQTDFNIHAHAVYCSQLIDAASPDNQVLKQNYHLLSTALEKLNEGVSYDLIVLYLELTLLPQFGTHIDFDHCAVCGHSGGPFDLSIRHQGVLCRQHQMMDLHRLQLDPNAIYIANQLIQMPLEHIRTFDIKPSLKEELRRMMDTIYQEFIGIHLKSKSFIKQWKNVDQEAEKLMMKRQSPNNKTDNDE